jgi:hypothetical protein
VPSFVGKHRRADQSFLYFSTGVFQTMDTYYHLLPLLQERAVFALKKVLF